jgi:hypothetical protein
LLKERQVKEEKPEAPIKVADLLQVLGVAMGLLASCILVAGYTWYIGHISAFGLDSSIMNRGLGDVIAESWYVGLMALIYLLPLWWYPFIFVAVVGALMLGGLYYISRQRDKGKNPLGDPITKQNQGRRILGLTQWHWVCWLEAVHLMCGWALVPIVLVLLTWLFIVFPFSEGNTLAKSEIEKYQKRGCTMDGVVGSPTRCISLVDISSPSVPAAQGLLVSSTNERIAIFNDKGLQVWPLTSSYRIDRAYITETSTTAEP